MKKHPFLLVDCHATVKLSPAEKKKLNLWLEMSGEVLKYLISKKIINTKKVASVRVSLLICGDLRMKQLNQVHRHKNYVTDVLSFPLHDNLRGTQMIGPELFLGDLAICHPQTKRQAKEFKIGHFDEFIHLFFHGLIHLMGYDHELGPKEEKLMNKWEKTALDKFSEIKKRA